MSQSPPDHRSTLAGEYALGMLDGAVRRHFELSLSAEPELQAEVERWERNLYRLADAVPPLAPPPRVWERIRGEIGRDGREPAQAPASAAASAPRAGLWESLGFWRGWALAATAATLVMAVALYLAPGASRVTYMVIVTDDAQSRASWVVSGDAGSNEVRVRSLSPQDLPGDRVFQLWVLPAGAATVQSVGLIPPDGDRRLTVPQQFAAVLANAQKLGVSVEPPGGSPTGQPTTTPLYHGTPLAL